MSDGESEVRLEVETKLKSNLKKISFFNKLQRVLSVEVSQTCLKRGNTARFDCSSAVRRTHRIENPKQMGSKIYTRMSRL